MPEAQTLAGLAQKDQHWVQQALLLLSAPGAMPQGRRQLRRQPTQLPTTIQVQIQTRRLLSWRLPRTSRTSSIFLKLSVLIICFGRMNTQKHAGDVSPDINLRVGSAE